ncbi:hypothetical protein CBR_g8595 [Chara braunii]|uniref:Prefoldin subunit 4 n=1 Tax=Chara braunii TaxID=69332 RepID=A0A388JS24_CHABU|nr:hypothetical protein CBR_g8595 [Chara braunii]|eukprot:GBG60573.1 hypothetical protein CBR_g8595 [Chara braunii]
MQKGDGVETPVTWEDQQRINTFNRLNTKFHEVDDEITRCKESLANLEDADSELILTEEEEVRYQMGEVFMRLPREDVQERLEKLTEETKHTLVRLIKEKEQLLSQMADLKKILYGKFKDSINLEED